MYSPKIQESLIPFIYREAKKLKIPMTKLVSQILREWLERRHNGSIETS